MKISVIGVGYVGLTQALGLAEFGFDVVGIDIIKEKVDKLNQGQTPLTEEGLEQLLSKHLNNNLSFTTDYSVIKNSDAIFLCVGTPPRQDGSTNLDFLMSAVNTMKPYLTGNHKLVIVKSTVPVGTTRKVYSMLRDNNVAVFFNPEFLREGLAIHDFFNPSRIVIGFDNNSKQYLNNLFKIYEYFVNKNTPFILTNWETAELIKYASNTFLAMKISFINELARFAEHHNIDIKTLSKGIGADPRIGYSFLNAGLGYGGSCLPKDVKSLIKQFEATGLEPKLISAIDSVNESQVKWFFNKIKQEYPSLEGKTFAIFGLAFKPKTDDLRESRGIAMIDLLLSQGSKIKAYDFVPNARANLLQKYINDHNIEILDDPYECVVNADGVIITTDDAKFTDLDWSKISELISNKIVFDGRNILDEPKLRALGFKYLGVGK
ncbi:UDP-glucose/GDP-mannose dehydrogenase family protein [Candidatus Woesearchaeota archaeon]|nr:UDP-glucose/GDP-mannose dehydrogenase family protein [Candidatus Woesearchaeota archaeon]